MTEQPGANSTSDSLSATFGAGASAPASGREGRGTLAIGVCTYNRGEAIARTLETLASMDRVGGRVSRFIIIDNRSSDGTASAIDRFIANHANVPMVRWHEATPGKSAALTKLFRETSEEFIGVIDDDVLASPNWARAMLSLMDDQARCGGAGGPVENIWENGITRIAQIYRRSLGDQLLGEARVCLEAPGSFLMGASMVMRREAILQSGWLDGRSMDCRRGDVLEGGEDAELCLKIRRAGWELWYEPTARAGHLIPAWRTTHEYIAKLRRSICRTEPMIRWLWDGSLTLDEARKQRLRARRKYLKTLLFDWRPTRRRVRVAERLGRVEGWSSLVGKLEAGELKRGG
ncbi:MAG: glycosyltransferase [Phycisphaerales bacterium]